MGFLGPKRDDPPPRPRFHWTWVVGRVPDSAKHWGATCRKLKRGPWPLQTYKTRRSQRWSVLSALRATGKNGGPVPPPFFLSKSGICLFESWATSSLHREGSHSSLSSNGWLEAYFTNNDPSSIHWFNKYLSTVCQGFVYADLNRTGHKPYSPGAYVPMKGGRW